MTVDIALIPDETISFAKQPPRGGVGGNPWIFMQLFDEAGNPISDRQMLGRCVQGLRPVALDFLNVTDVSLDISGDCTNTGPYITLSGAISFGGVNAVLSFQNSKRNPPHRRDEVVDVEMSILRAGDSITFEKQPPLGGVGGNPRIYLQFIDDNGDPLGEEVFLGRCRRLGR